MTLKDALIVGDLLCAIIFCIIFIKLWRAEERTKAQRLLFVDEVMRLDKIKSNRTPGKDMVPLDENKKCTGCNLELSRRHSRTMCAKLKDAKSKPADKVEENETGLFEMEHADKATDRTTQNPAKGE